MVDILKYLSPEMTKAITETAEKFDEVMASIKQKETKMTQSKHTPGPWYVDEDDESQGYPFIRIDTGAFGENYQEVCQTSPEFDTNTQDFSITETTRANARLIAAAPELLEVCKLLLDELVDHGIDNDTGLWNDDTVTEKARRAISKAEGGAE